MIQLPPDFKEFLKLLNSNGVEYLLVGGLAVGFHGYPRTTGDMDVWVAMSPPNAAKLVRVLSQFGFGDTGADDQLFLTADRVIRLGVPPLRIEVLTSVSGVSFADCFARRIVKDIEGVWVNIIELDDLRKNKQAAGRPKDQDDLQHLP